MNLIPLLQNKANSARTQMLADIFNEVDRLARAAEQNTKSDPEDDGQPEPAQKEPITVLASQLKVTSSKTVLQNEDDVTGYLNDFKKTLLEQIHAGKKVIV